MSAIAQTGGPDAAGYSYINSDAVGGSIYTWIELDTATALGGTGIPSTANGVYNGHQANIPLSFTFPFYGHDYNAITINTNGTVYFESLNLTWANVCMPGDPAVGFSADTAIIATVWQALSTQGMGGLFYKDFGTYFVVEYSNVPEWGETDGDTWELILYANGDIIMQFKETSLTSNWGHTTGIQGTPTIGLEYQCYGGGEVIHDDLAILWSNPFIGIEELDQLELSIYPNPNNGEFEINFSALGESSHTIIITDTKGSIVYSKSIENSSGKVVVELNHLEAGIYFVTLSDNSSSTTKKIVLK